MSTNNGTITINRRRQKSDHCYQHADLSANMTVLYI